MSCTSVFINRLILSSVQGGILGGNIPLHQGHSQDLGLELGQDLCLLYDGLTLFLGLLPVWGLLTLINFGCQNTPSAG